MNISIIMQTCISGLLLGGIYSLISIGLVLIFGVTRIINFAHGEFLMMAMYATFWLFQLGGMDPYISLLIVTPLLFMGGIATQRIIIQPLLRAPASMQLFATLGLSIVLQNVAFLLWKPDYRTLQTSYSTMTLSVGNLFISFPRLIAFVISIVIIIILFIILKNTYLGKAIRATVQNRTAAQMMGINISRISLLAFGLGAACVGIAGTLLMPIFYVFPSVGTHFVIIAFVVVVLGGMDSLPGAFIGGLILGLVKTFSGFYLGSSVKEMVYLIIFIIVLLVKPAGIFGVVGSEELGAK